MSQNIRFFKIVNIENKRVFYNAFGQENFTEKPHYFLYSFSENGNYLQGNNETTNRTKFYSGRSPVAFDKNPKYSTNLVGLTKKQTREEFEQELAKQNLFLVEETEVSPLLLEINKMLSFDADVKKDFSIPEKRIHNYLSTQGNFNY